MLLIIYHLDLACGDAVASWLVLELTFGLHNPGSSHGQRHCVLFLPLERP